MQTHIELGRVFGIKIGLHYSWFLIALLIVLSLAREFGLEHREWGDAAIWSLSVVTAMLFFVTLLLHELAHSLVAQARKAPVRSITLFALGGVSQLEKNPADARTEFWMAIVGPITSIAIGLGCLGAALQGGWRPDAAASTRLTALLVWLGYINLGLGVFNLIPGYPLDGGRVLRAALWWRTGDADRSMRIAARVGQGVALLFIGFGVVQVFAGWVVNGLWITFIGWFLAQAAAENYFQVQVGPILDRLHVGDLMTREYPVVDGRSDLQHFVDDKLLRTGRRYFVVEEKGAVVGLITPDEVKHVDRGEWPFTPVSNAMLPLNRMRTVTPQTSLRDAMDFMASAHLGQLPVVSDGHLDGMISRAEVLQLFQTQTELRASL